MGVDHGGTGGHVPRIWSRGTIMQIVPRRFCHISTKMSVLWPSKNAKIRFRPGLSPGPRWGSSRRSPRPSSRLKRGHPSPYPTLFGTNPPSALAMRPPRIPARSTPMVFSTLILTENYNNTSSYSQWQVRLKSVLFGVRISNSPLFPSYRAVQNLSAQKSYSPYTLTKWYWILNV